MSLWRNDLSASSLRKQGPIFDANVFIEAKNRYYAFDICPGFWDWMDHVAKADAGSVVPICDELRKGTDELAKWANDRRLMPWFLKIDDAETQKALQSIASYVNGAAYKPEAKAKFLSGADPWLIAKAQVIGARCAAGRRTCAEKGASRRVDTFGVFKGRPARKLHSS